MTRAMVRRYRKSDRPQRRRASPPWRNSLARLHGLAVDAAQRRRRAATALVAAAETFARDAAARGVCVDTPVDNDAARAFYEGRAYLTDYVMTRYHADDLDGVTYVRFFTP